MSDLLGSTDAEIEQHVQSGDPMTLRGLLYQLTGDEAVAATKLGEAPGMIMPVKTLVDAADIELVRAAAAAYLRTHRDAGAPAVGPGRQERLPRSLGLAAGADIPASAVEFCIEELGIERIPRRHQFQHVPPDIGKFHVVVIGSGVGGINAAVNLQECGIPFTVLEQNDDVGGTWHDNCYPGCRVDVPSLAYSHSFGLHYPWDHWFAPQRENNRYLQWCVDTFGVRDHIRFCTEVTGLTWNEDTSTWRVDVKDAEGDTATLTANVVISAVGFLSRPKFPAIKGIETFEGPAFHTAWWDHAFDHPSGKHLAVIGTGCSGMQLVPELERRGARVTVFQRRPSWIFEVPIYRAELPAGLKWLDRNMPYYRNFEKFRAVWMVGDHLAAAPYMRDPAWGDPDSLSEINQSARRVSLDYLQRKLGDRPELLAACTPHSPAMASRPVIDNGWLDAIRGPNVELVTDAIGRIVPEGVVTESGRIVDADAIVFATGFETSKFLWPMEVTGRRGTLNELWAKDGARAYLGITMPGFPNLFCIYGPNTNSNPGTIPTMGSELQTRYALQCIEELFRTASTSIDLKPEAYDEYNRRLDEGLRKTIFSDPRLDTYYINEHGRSSSQTCWTTLEYWQMTRRPDFTDYVLS
jgi:4-hydroxyacetophenone monooxygenase